MKSKSILEEPMIKKPDKRILARIRSLKKNEGRVAAIVPETGRYRTGKTLNEAIKKAKKEYPGKIFYVIRIGIVKH